MSRFKTQKRNDENGTALLQARTKWYSPVAGLYQMVQPCSRLVPNGTALLQGCTILAGVDRALLQIEIEQGRTEFRATDLH